MKTLVFALVVVTLAQAQTMQNKTVAKICDETGMREYRDGRVVRVHVCVLYIQCVPSTAPYTPAVVSPSTYSVFLVLLPTLQQ